MHRALAPILFIFSIFSFAPLNGAEGRYIVVLKQGVDADSAADDLSKKGRGAAKQKYRTALNGFSCSAADANALRGDPRVAYVANDRVVTLGLGLNGRKRITSTPSTQFTPTGVRRIRADLFRNLNKRGLVEDIDVDVAVVDTGVDLAHPDLNVSWDRQATFVAGTTSAQDDYGHGTHVAGTIGARDNNFGVLGVAPGARIWAVKVISSAGFGYWSDVIAGIDWIAAHAGEIEVVNMSFGGFGTDYMDPYFPDPFHQAIINASALGVVFVAAAGNDNGDAQYFVPAAFDEVITASAMVDTDGFGGGGGFFSWAGADDSLAGFSNWGHDIDVAAPGVDILSTYYGNGYAYMSGTSMACPHVVGAVALYLQRPDKLKNPSHPKPRSQADVNALKAAIAGCGFPYGSYNGFTGDRDDMHEPVINAEAICAPLIPFARN